MPAQTKPKETKPASQPSSLKTLLSWEAPERHFKKRSREYFTTIGAMVFLAGVILFFIREWFLIVVLIAFMFVVYIMATVEPRKIKHLITTQGLITGGRTYKWEELTRFWFMKKWGEDVLQIETFAGLPRHLTLLLEGTKPEQIKKILSKHLPFEEPEKAWIDSAGEWVSRRVPLESSS